MKKIILSGLMAIVACTSSIASDYDYPYLLFTMADGTTHTAATADLQMVVSGGNLVATNASGTQQFALTDLTSMQFMKDLTDGVETIGTNTDEAQGSVMLFDMSGRQLPQRSLSQLSSGIYVVKTADGRTVKAILR